MIIIELLYSATPSSATGQCVLSTSTYIVIFFITTAQCAQVDEAIIETKAEFILER